MSHSIPVRRRKKTVPSIKDRVNLPAEIERKVLAESGDRCAVCGEPLPLDRAHIIPWSKTKTHTVGNLICLCANCHRRAHAEHWSAHKLREYKKRPWVLKRFDVNPTSMVRPLSLQADVLKGQVQICGWGQSDGVRHTTWHFWLELYLAPEERYTATIPIHKIVCAAQIENLRSDQFFNVTIEEVYELLPDVHGQTHGRRKKPLHATIDKPKAIVVLGYFSTDEWKSSSETSAGQLTIRMQVAEDDYNPLDVIAILKQVKHGESSLWSVERH